MAEGDTAAARDVLDELLRGQPDHSAAHMTLCHIAWSQDRVRDSARHALEAARNPPADSNAIVAVAIALLRVGETVAARNCLKHPALAATETGDALMYHAALRRQLGDDAQALTLLDRAHATGVDGSEFRFLRGVESIICGDLSKGEADLEASLAMDPAASAAALELARLRKQTGARNHLEDFDRRRNRVMHGTQDHAALEFARYKELEDLGRHEEAWNALQIANGVMRSLFPCDREAMRGQVDGLIRTCSSRFVDAEQVDNAGPQPIFILGLPRSGTTLLDRLLGSHPQIVSAGELDDFSHQLCRAADQRMLLDARMLDSLPDLDYREVGQRYLMQTRWRANGARCFIDKQPWNHIVAGLIHRALPGARIVHVVRDAMDVCFSSYRAMLGARYPWSFDLGALADQYREYRRLHAHWRTVMPEWLLDVSYRDLIDDTETTLRKVVDFCGLGWDPACLDSTRNATAVGTLSAVQARGPIHGRAFGEWRHYERQLAGLHRDLAALD